MSPVSPSTVVFLSLIIKKNFNGVFSTNNNNSEVIIEEKIKFNKEKDCIGEGGFSRVYKYNCDILKTSFAYKILDPSSFNSAPYEINVARFINEAKTLLTFNHENIVKIYNVGRVIPNSYYIKMEWIDGKELKGYISENGPIDIDTFINILSQSFAINNNLGAVEIFRNILNHNSIYLFMLLYFVSLKTYFGKKYFNYYRKKS